MGQKARGVKSGVEMMVYVNPFLVDVSEKPNARRNLFKEALAAGYLIQHQDGSPYLILNTDFSAGLIDLSNPAARAWIKQVIKDELISTGALGWMADFGEALPYDAKLHSGESAAYWHNLYPEEWQRVNREAIQEAGLGDQVVFFSRSGYTRSPGLTTLFWLGDQLVSWDEHDGIKTAVTGLVTGGISGYSLNHSDIGGYTAITNPIRNYHRSKELLQRWTELSAFNVVFRTHEGNRPDENFQIYSDDEMLRFFDRFARVFAALAEYRKGLVQDAARLGHPVVRAMFVEFPNDPEVRSIVYEQFMFGPDFLVAPVLDEGESTVDAYLPAGEWIHLWSGATYGDAARGVRITVDAPLGQPGVFYKKGSRAGETLRARLTSENLL
jgi:sulfoquinovosidase